jgi:hypothetical protein
MWPFPIPDQTTQQKAYAAGLYARLGELTLLRKVEVSIGDWKPLAKDCHQNATTLYLNRPEYSPVWGWLYFDFGGLLDHVRFIAHSAVRAPNGELWDITPTDVATRYPFLAAVESEDDYAALTEGGVSELWHRK